MAGLGLDLGLGLSLTGGGASGPVAMAIVNNANTTVTSLGGGVYNVSGDFASGQWSGDAVSSQGVAGDCTVRIHITQTTVEVLFGLNTDPLTNSSYNSVDRALVTRNGGSVEAWEDGVGGASIATVAVGDYLFIQRVGTAVKAYKGATSDIASATLINTYTAKAGTLYFDSSLNINATFDVLFTAP